MASKPADADAGCRTLTISDAVVPSGSVPAARSMLRVVMFATRCASGVRGQVRAWSISGTLAVVTSVDYLVNVVYFPHVLAALHGFQRRLGGELSTRMRDTGILRGSEGRVLALIEADGTRPTSLAEGSWITKQAIGKRVRDLEERGLVVVRPDPADGRAVRVHRTSKGDRVKAETETRIAALERDLAAEVGEHRYRIFREVLDELGRA